jgi:hypothetical protein
MYNKFKGLGFFIDEKRHNYALTNFDIMKIMNERKGKLKTKFIGVFSRDDLPQKINNNESLIFNLDDLKGNGTHWTSIYNCNDSKYCEYWDSYGLAPPQEAIKLMRKTNKKIAYSNSQIQSVNSVLCGYYCMYYINERDNNKSMYDIIYSFDHIIGDGLIKKNDPKLLLDYFNIN